MSRQERILRRRALADRLAKSLLTDPEGALWGLTKVSMLAFAHGMLLGGVAGVVLGWVVWG